jgi:deoxyribonuclease-1-like protein
MKTRTARILLVLTIVLLLVGLCIAFWKYNHNQTQTDRSTLQQSEISIQKETLSKECGCKFVSWNLANFGKSKSQEELQIIAKIINDSNADVVAVQEVTASKKIGAQTLAKLADELSRRGSKWDYLISDPTAPASPEVERYGYLLRGHSVKTNHDTARLVEELAQAIEREPYTATFELKNCEAVQVFTIHTVPTEKVPMNEITALVQAKELKESQRAIVAGDFNLGPEMLDAPFARIGFMGHIRHATSLKKMLREGEYFNRQYDNVYTKGLHVCSGGIIDFVQENYSPLTEESYKQAHHLSDHVPVYITFQ